MKKQNLLTLLSIVTMTISLLVTPASAHASTLASDQSASMANDILLAGGQEEVAVTLLTADTCTGEITGSGQPGAFVKVHHNGRVYATRVCPDGYWSVIANPAVNYGEKVTAIQKDKNGTTSAFTASASRCSVNSNIAQFNFITCEYKYCPYCCEALPLDADVCPNCKADLNGNANTTQTPEKPEKPERPGRPNKDKIVISHNEISCDELLDRDMALSFLDAANTTVRFKDITVMVKLGRKSNPIELIPGGYEIKLTEYEGKTITIDYMYNDEVLERLRLSVECADEVFELAKDAAKTPFSMDDAKKAPDISKQELWDTYVGSDTTYKIDDVLIRATQEPGTDVDLENANDVISIVPDADAPDPNTLTLQFIIKDEDGNEKILKVIKVGLEAATPEVPEEP